MLDLTQITYAKKGCQVIKKITPLNFANLSESSCRQYTNNEIKKSANNMKIISRKQVNCSY
jgi:hypothetical protein